MARIDLTKLTPAQRQERQNLRNAYFAESTASQEEGAQQHQELGNWFAVCCIVELISENDYQDQLATLHNVQTRYNDAQWIKRTKELCKEANQERKEEQERQRARENAQWT